MGNQTQVLVLTVPNAAPAIVKVIEAGAAGFATRETSLEELIDIIDATANGKLLCSQEIAGCMQRRLTELANGSGLLQRLECLTEREMEILDLIETGLSNKEIARCLNIQISTVKNHVHNILQKLQVLRRSQAVALKRGMA